MVRASDLPGVRERLQPSVMATWVKPVLREPDGDGAVIRAHLFAAQVDGLLTALAVRENSVFMSIPVQDPVDLHAPLLQQALTRVGELAFDTGR